MDIASFREIPLLHDPGHLRTDLDNTGRFSFPDEFQFIGDGLIRDFDDVHLRDRGRRRGGGFLLATGWAGCSDQQQGNGQVCDGLSDHDLLVMRFEMRFK